MNPPESTGGLPSNSLRFAVAAADTSPDVHIVGGFRTLFFCRRHFITSDDVMKLNWRTPKADDCEPALA